MHEWPRISSYGKLGLVIITSIIVLGARFCWIDVAGATWFQSFLGYYFILALSVIWTALLFKEAKKREVFSWAYWREHRHALVLMVALVGFVHVHEPHINKVLYDEPAHAVTAMVMHLDKKALMASQSNYVGDLFVLTGHYAAFRQYLFPFAVSLLHDFTGYRDCNIFIFNFILTPIVLFLVYLIGCEVKNKFAGLVAMGLLGTVPLFGQNVTSAGYDILNAALLGGAVYFGILYFKSTGVDRGSLMNLSLCTVLLLAVARSESILYVPLWALLVAVLWYRERRVELTWFSIISPVFLLPHLLSNLIMTSNELAMDASLRKGGQAFFDIHYLPQHLSEAVYYFFNFNRGSTNSVVLSILGVVGFVAVIMVVGRAAKHRSFASDFVIAAFALWITLVYLFVLTQYWSSPNDGLAARFSLPLMLIWSVLAGWLVGQFRWSYCCKRAAFVMFIVWVVVAAGPMSSRAFVTYNLAVSRAEKWFIDYAASRERQASLFVESSNVGLMAQRYASSRMEYLRTAPAVFVRAIKAGLYHEVIVFQILEDSKGEWRPRRDSDLPENIVLETVDERMVSPVYVARISRLKGYKKLDGSLVTPKSDDEEINLKRSFKDGAEWRQYRMSLYP